LANIIHELANESEVIAWQLCDWFANCLNSEF